MDILTILIFILMGYFFGSIPTALIMSKRKKIDIRQHGSGNIGGTNTFRVLGKKYGFIVSIVDILKGVAPTFIAMLYGGASLAAIAGISASIGHSYSIFVGFKGGKSVATSTGVILVFNPLAIVTGAVVFATVLFLTKYVSLSSMLAAISVVLFMMFFEDSIMIKYATFFFGIFIILRHYTNIKRLLKGEESKAFQKNKSK